MKLTKRDKLLLYVLAIVVTLAVFIPLVILPQWNKQGKLADSLTEREQKVQEMKQGIAQLEANKQLLEKKQAEFEKTMKDYYPIMESYAIERMITKMALDQGLTAKDFVISTKPFNSKLYPYFASELAFKTDMTDLDAAETADKYEGETAADKKEGKEEKNQTIIYSSKVKATVIGDRDKMEKLIDTIYSNYPPIRMAGFEIATDTVLKTDNSVGKNTTLTLNLEIYMCQK